MDGELFEIYKRNFPFNIRKKDTVLGILNHEDNIVLERRDEKQRLIGVSVVNQNAVLLLCVDEEYRNQGIGTELLEKSEKLIKEHGYSRMVVGAGFDYLMPGVPTSRRYVRAENEELYENIGEVAGSFFEKRGYVHSWECNCFDMRVSFSGQEKGRISSPAGAVPKYGQIQDGYRVGDVISGVTYRWAKLEDLSEICQCTDLDHLYGYAGYKICVYYMMAEKAL